MAKSTAMQQDKLKKSQNPKWSSVHMSNKRKKWMWSMKCDMWSLYHSKTLCHEMPQKRHGGIEQGQNLGCWLIQATNFLPDWI